MEHRQLGLLAVLVVLAVSGTVAVLYRIGVAGTVSSGPSTVVVVLAMLALVLIVGVGYWRTIGQ